MANLGIKAHQSPLMVLKLFPATAVNESTRLWGSDTGASQSAFSAFQGGVKNSRASIQLLFAPKAAQKGTVIF